MFIIQVMKIQSSSKLVEVCLKDSIEMGNILNLGKEAAQLLLRSPRRELFELVELQSKDALDCSFVTLGKRLHIHCSALLRCRALCQNSCTRKMVMKWQATWCWQWRKRLHIHFSGLLVNRYLHVSRVVLGRLSWNGHLFVFTVQDSWWIGLFKSVRLNLEVVLKMAGCLVVTMEGETKWLFLWSLGTELFNRFIL